MKKLFIWVITLCLILTNFSSTHSSAEAAGAARITIEVNGSQLKLDAEPVLTQGRLLVPVRAIIESLGGNVSWEAATGKIKGTKEDIHIELQINQAKADVNGQEILLDAPPRIINNRTMIPLRFVSENLGAKVIWDGSGRKVEVYTFHKDAKEIVVGLNLELSGAISSYAKSTLDGIQLAVDEINAGGGLLGKQIKLVSYDNMTDTQSVPEGISRLVAKEHAVAILGPIASSNVLSAVEKTSLYGIPLITPTGTNPQCTIDETGKTRPYIFRNVVTDQEQAKYAVSFAQNSLKTRSAAVIFDKRNDYSISIANEFVLDVKNKDFIIKAQEGFNDITEDEIGSIIEKVMKQNPDVVFMPAYYAEAGQIIRELRLKGYSKPIIGTDGYDSSEILNIAGSEALQKVYFTNHYSDSDPAPGNVKFIKAFEDKYNYTPDTLAALGYESAYYLADAVTRAGAADPAEITKALASTKDFQGLNGTWSIDDTHSPVKPIVILTFDSQGLPIYEETIKL